MVTEDNNGCIGVEFLMGAGGDFAHRHEQAVGEAGGLKLPGFADIQQEGRIGL